ncbi:hypothetical protein [Streptosporangium nondiastaticum]|uniref:hypothetical protein n=1 Tax=Streptosporangium nondiastaticum TaxID=35764 RepID=UPI0031F79EA6
MERTASPYRRGPPYRRGTAEPGTARLGTARRAARRTGGRHEEDRTTSSVGRITEDEGPPPIWRRSRRTAARTWSDYGTRTVVSGGTA